MWGALLIPTTNIGQGFGQMLNKEDIILLFLEDPKKLAHEIGEGNVLESDEIRTLIYDLGDPCYAYRYARYIDKRSTEETRTVACKDSFYAYYYSEFIDNSPHPDTRQGACKDSFYAYFYAINIDKSPRSDTRESACKDPECKKEYEEWENSLKKK